MSLSVASRVLRLAALLIFVGAFAYPTLALMTSCGTGPHDGASWLPSLRQWGLLGRSAGLSLAATILSLVLALPATVVVAQGSRGLRQALFSGMMAATLLCPPMVYSFGWDRLLPLGTNPYARCILQWALWAWPIPAWIIAAGWRRGGRRAYEAALLETSPLRAMFFAARPVLQPYVALSALVLFAVFFSDYGVPHACGLIVYATELLGWASNSTDPLATVRPAAPAVGLIVVALIGILAFRPRDSSADYERVQPRSRPLATFAAWLILTLGCVLPIVALVLKLSSPSAFALALRTYAADLLASVLVAVGAGIVSAGIGWAVVGRRMVPTVAAGWSAMLGALPAALTGVALVEAYNHTYAASVYNHWPIVLLSYVGHYGWIGVVAATLGQSPRRNELFLQAQVDGADALTAIDRVLLPTQLPVLLAAAAIVAVLSIGDVAACSLVRVPGYTPVAHIIIEKFHRFEDDMLIALSLILVAAAGLAALVVARVAGRLQE